MIFLAARIHQGGSSLSIYGEYYPTLKYIQDYLIKQIELYADTTREETGEAAFEHLITRIKSEDSMREKCERKGIEPSPQAVLQSIHDAIGIRVVCRFVDDVYETVRALSRIPFVELRKKRIISKT